MEDFNPRIRVRVSGRTFNTLYMVRVRFRAILGYGVIINTSTGAHTKLQTAVRQISASSKQWGGGPSVKNGVERKNTTKFVIKPNTTAQITRDNHGNDNVN